MSKRNELAFEITLAVSDAYFCLHLGPAARTPTRPLTRSAKRA
jgi:hypothetical protein